MCLMQPNSIFSLVAVAAFLLVALPDNFTVALTFRGGMFFEAVTISAIHNDCFPAPSAPSLAAPFQYTLTATLMAAKKAKGMSFAD